MAKIKKLDEFIRGFKTKEYTLDNAPSKFFKDKETILKLVPHDHFGDIYKYLPRKIQKDEPFISELVGVNGYIFLKANRYHDKNNMALNAIKTCPDAAKFLNLEGKNGLKLAQQAVEENAFAYRYLNNYTDDPKVITTTLSSQGILYRYMSQQNQLVEDYAKIALTSNPFVYKLLPEELKNSAELASVAISTDKGYAYSIYKTMLTKELQANPYISVLAVSKNLESIFDVPNQTYVDPDFQKMFNEMTEQTKEIFKQQNDEEGLQNYEQKLDNFVAEKNQIILEEKLNNIFDEKQKFDGICEVSAENFDNTKNFSAPIDKENPTQNLEE